VGTWQDASASDIEEYLGGIQRKFVKYKLNIFYLNRVSAKVISSYHLSSILNSVLYESSTFTLKSGAKDSLKKQESPWRCKSSRKSTNKTGLKSCKRLFSVDSKI